MDNMKYLFKDAFAVIGKAGQGAVDKGPEWIAPLWENAGANYSEITSICRKDDKGGLFWWGAMNDSEEENKRWSDTGKYMPGCEADVGAIAPDGWTKWIIPAQTYLVVSTSPDKYGEVFGKVVGDKDNVITGAIHEYYPVPDNPSIMELWFPVADGKVFCRSCSMPMTKPEDFGTEKNGNQNRDYCSHCYGNGTLRNNVTMEKLTADVQKLIDIENEHTGLLSRPLLSYIKEWLALEGDAKVVAIPVLHTRLVDGQDCDFTGTQWEKEWLVDGKVCHCVACVAARKCISDIKLIRV